MRRLPVYLLIDCSESMAGQGMDSVNKGVQALLTALRSDPQSLESVALSIITFSKEASQVVPLSDVSSIRIPLLSVRPGTSLGAALRLLVACLDREVVRTTREVKGDFRPLILLMTDGQPTDDWESGVEILKKQNTVKIANFYAIAIGEDVDTDLLRQITDIVLTLKDDSPETFKKFFVWMSASVQSHSVSAARSVENTDGPIVKLPDNILKEAVHGAGRQQGVARQVFLHVLCSKLKKPYLMRYVRDEATGRYLATASHPLEMSEAGDAQTLPSVNSSLLVGCPPCPHCNNPSAATCSCGALFCMPHKSEGVVICPQCNSQLTKGNSESFELRQSVG